MPCKLEKILPRLWDKTLERTQLRYHQKSIYATNIRSKKYGFTVDYARLDVVYTYGGIYLDTDVELLQSLDNFLNDQCFMGCETDSSVALGLGFGAEPKNEIIFELMRSYDGLDFILADGKLNLIPSPAIQTNKLKQMGITPNGKNKIIFNNCHIYPKEVFNPCDLDTFKINPTEHTVSIHHYAGSWLTKQNKLHKKQLVYMYFILYNSNWGDWYGKNK